MGITMSLFNNDDDDDDKQISLEETQVD